MLAGQVLCPLSIAQHQCMQYMCFSSSTSNRVAKFDSFPPKEGRGEPGSANRERMIFVFWKLHSVITQLWESGMGFVSGLLVTNKSTSFLLDCVDSRVWDPVNLTALYTKAIAYCRSLPALSWVVGTFLTTIFIQDNLWQMLHFRGTLNQISPLSRIPCKIQTF